MPLDNKRGEERRRADKEGRTGVTQARSTGRREGRRGYTRRGGGGNSAKSRPQQCRTSPRRPREDSSRLCACAAARTARRPLGSTP